MTNAETTIKGPARFVSAAGVDCMGCGAQITDGIHAPFWADNLGPAADPHYCDHCYGLTAEYDGMVQTMTPARQFQHKVARVVGDDGVPMWIHPDAELEPDADGSYYSRLDAPAPCDVCGRPTTRLICLSNYEACPECFSADYADGYGGDPMRHQRRD